MSARLLEGRVIAAKIKENLQKEIEALTKKYKHTPSLATIQVGENPASAVYLKSQIKTAEKLGIKFNLHSLDKNTTQDKLIQYIEKLNSDSSVNGILMQMPLPKGINSKEIFEDSYFDTCHLITNIEQLRPQQEATIWRYLKLGWCSYQNFALKTKEIIHNNGMIILTTKDISKVPPPILSAVDYKIGIEPYNQANLELLIHMMLSYSGIDYNNDEEVLKTIIEYACGELDIIINDILKVCILLAQSEGEMKLTVAMVEKASKLI